MGRCKGTRPPPSCRTRLDCDSPPLRPQISYLRSASAASPTAWHIGDGFRFCAATQRSCCSASAPQSFPASPSRPLQKLFYRSVSVGGQPTIDSSRILVSTEHKPGGKCRRLHGSRRLVTAP